MAAENFTGTSTASSKCTQTQHGLLPGGYYIADGRGWALSINPKSGLAAVVKNGTTVGALLNKADAGALRRLLELNFPEETSAV